MNALERGEVSGHRDPDEANTAWEKHIANQMVEDLCGVVISEQSPQKPGDQRAREFLSQERHRIRLVYLCDNGVGGRLPILPTDMHVLAAARRKVIEVRAELQGRYDPKGKGLKRLHDYERVVELLK